MNHDNITAAIDHLMTSTTPTRTPRTGSTPGNPATKQLLIRCTQHDRDRWKQAAARQGISASEFIRDTLNARAAELLDCKHPPEARRTYPWSETCLACGERLRG